MGILDFVTIGIFTLGILLAGVSFSKSGSSMKNFFAAGGEVPWWISGLSLFMGFFSAGTFVVWGSIAYSSGWVAISIQATMCIAGFVVGFFFAPRWNKTGIMTAAEYIRERFGVKVQKMYTYLFLFISMFTTGSFLYPVAKIVEVSTGLPLQSSILLLGGISILYVTVGGLWAVVVTDVLQFVILTAAVLIVVPLSFDRVGGMESFTSGVPEGFFNLFNDEYSLYFIIPFCLYNLSFLGGNWSYVQRYTTVRSPRDAKKVGWLFGSLYLICPILWMLPPMLYRVVNPELNGLADEGAYLMMCKEVLPSGLLGLMLGGMIFATASSLNGTLNISAGVFTNDIFKRLRPETSDDKLMKIARYSTIGFGLLAIVVALLIPLMGGIVNVVISVAALTGVPLYLPIIWTLFSKRQTARSVMTITLTSLAINGFFKFVTPYLFHFSFNRAEEMLTGVLFPLVMLIAYEVLNRKNPQAWKLVRREEPTVECEPKESSDNSFSIRVIGMGITFTGLVIGVLGLLAESGRILIPSVGLALIVLGGVVLLKNRKRKDDNENRTGS